MDKGRDMLHVEDTLLSRTTITEDTHVDEPDQGDSIPNLHDCCVTLMNREYKLIQIREDKTVTQIFHPGLSNIQLNDKIIELNGESMRTVSRVEFIERFKSSLQMDEYVTMIIQRLGDGMTIEHLNIRTTVACLPDIDSGTKTAFQTTQLPGQQKFWTIVDNDLQLHIIRCRQFFKDRCIFKLYRNRVNPLTYNISWKDRKYLCAVNPDTPTLVFKDGNVNSADPGAEFRIRRNENGSAFESVYIKDFYIHYSQDGEISLKKSMFGRHPPGQYRFNIMDSSRGQAQTCRCLIQ